MIALVKAWTVVLAPAANCSDSRAGLTSCIAGSCSRRSLSGCPAGVQSQLDFPDFGPKKNRCVKAGGAGYVYS
jgi:hypothetical protein